MTFKDNGLRITVVLPSLNPTQKLVSTVKGLVEEGFSDIIIVNDGSGPDFDKFFDEVASLEQCTLLKHETNKGKGAALKTAFLYIQQQNKDIAGIVTADADGQHLPKDILKCAQQMTDNETVILGARNFNKSHVPIKSFLGNKITSFVFKTSCGININDTQTGLRVFPVKYIPFLLSIKGERFEYETNMLLEMKPECIPFREVEITTVYEDKNVGSHFNAVRDAFRIYKLIFKFMMSSIISFFIDNIIFIVSLYIFANAYEDTRILISTILARAVSSFINFNFNRKTVFKHKSDYRKCLLRYYVLCIPLMLISAGIVTLLSDLMPSEKEFIITLIKIGVEAILFFISFSIQRDWVFKKCK